MTRQEALAELLQCLKARDYEFIAVTPATHARVLSRAGTTPLTVRDIFGWNRLFEAGDLDSDLLALLRASEALDACDGKLKSRVRIASVGADLLLHGSYPTDEPDSVFLGPDTYRFVRFVAEHLPSFAEARWLVDMGAGSGAGAIAAARLGGFEKITMVDTNAAALELAAVNARVAGVGADTLRSDTLPAGADLVIANPPYMMDLAARSYRDGGSLLGGELALNWATQALANLGPGGAMLLYTGAAFIDGQAPLVAALENLCGERGARFEIDEIDPDVFGEELDQPGYERVERIATVGALLFAG